MRRTWNKDTGITDHPAARPYTVAESDCDQCSGPYSAAMVVLGVLRTLIIPFLRAIHIRFLTSSCESQLDSRNADHGVMQTCERCLGGSDAPNENSFPRASTWIHFECSMDKTARRNDIPDLSSRLLCHDMAGRRLPNRCASNVASSFKT